MCFFVNLFCLFGLFTQTFEFESTFNFSMKVTLDLNWEIKSNKLVIMYYDLK